MDSLDSIRKIFMEFRSDPHSRQIFGVLSGALFIVGLVSLSIEYLVSLHWSLGGLLTVASGGLAMWIARLTFRPHQSISMDLVFFFMSVLLGAVACSGISYILYTQGWASYNVPQEVTIETFRNYYLWTFLDMVPAIDIWKTFPVKSPVEPTDTVAGTPMLVFRIFILGFVFAGIRRWWKLHVVDNPAESKKDIDPNR
jgi:ABC-type transport system involved in multi-copper enzyme maturation permease subunit